MIINEHRINILSTSSEVHNSVSCKVFHGEIGWSSVIGGGSSNFIKDVLRER